MRVDAGLARLLGLSRTAAAALAEDGGVDLDGAPAGKSDRLTAGAWLEVRLPEAPRPLENHAGRHRGHGHPVRRRRHRRRRQTARGRRARHASAGPARRCSAGWPPRASGSAPPGIHERQGIVHRLDVGTSGVMVVAHLGTRLHRAQAGVQGSAPCDKRYHALVQGHPDPSSGTIDAPIGRHRGHDWKFAVTEDGRHSVTHYDTVEAFQAASLLDIQLETGPHPPDPGPLRRTAPPVLRRPDLRRRSDAGETARAGTAMAARPVAGVRASRRRAAGRDHQSRTRRICSTRSTCCAITSCDRRGPHTRTGMLFGVGAFALVGPVSRRSSRCCCPRDRSRCWRTASCGAPCAWRWCSLVVRRFGDLRRLSGRTWLLLAAASALISVNWGDLHLRRDQRHVVDAALGYFINPLVTVALGVLVFRERIGPVAARRAGARRGRGGGADGRAWARRPTSPSFWRCRFALYGVVKKVVAADPRVSVAVENCIALPVGAAAI